MRYSVLAILMAAEASLADPVSCSQVSEYVIKGVRGCRCTLNDYGIVNDSVGRRNIVQFCDIYKGQYLTVLQMRLPSTSWVTYELMDCEVLDEENVSCRGQKIFGKDTVPKFVNSPKDVYDKFMVNTYGSRDMNYLHGARR